MRVLESYATSISIHRKCTNQSISEKCIFYSGDYANSILLKLRAAGFSTAAARSRASNEQSNHPDLNKEGGTINLIPIYLYPGRAYTLGGEFMDTTEREHRGVFAAQTAAVSGAERRNPTCIYKQKLSIKRVLQSLYISERYESLVVNIW